ncbi:hypothetical protein A6E01_07900 [Vibrio breoganii]|uniref:Uncharacterized protein n=1 Tax=Vibrio breoganii TaxID=553239 RepID=A0AAN0XV76_9VIBR|nr:hypothetical protein [Vibrio breoganii]ANO33136.1 hypothetical protein A6E01_07900 [Vibrio breoganii]
MAIPVITIKDDRQDLYAPYSGLILYGENSEQIVDIFDKADGREIEEDPTLLFCYVSDISMYSYLHPKLREIFNLSLDDDMDPRELCNAINAESALALQHDAGWSGETWWGFGKL